MGPKLNCNLTIAFLLVAVATGCVERAAKPTPAPAVDHAAEREALMRTSREWSQTVERGEFDKALDYWADDAVIMAPGQPPIRGKEAIRAFVRGASQIPGFRIRWEPLEAHVSEAGDMAYLIERNEISTASADGQSTEHNKVVTIWRKQPDGSWKNVVDMWNGQPAPAARDGLSPRGASSGAP